jgi:hypothetical protein
VDEPVDQGGGDHGVAEDLAPLLEAAVGGDDDRAAFVAAGDEREEQVGGLALQGQVANFVDDEQVVALQPAQLGLELVAVLGGLELGDPLLRGGEGDAVAALAAFMARAIARWVLPVPGGPRKQTLARSSIQASWARWSTSGFSAEGWALQSKSSSVFSAGKVAWRIRMRAPEASRAKTSASSSASRNCS